MAHGKFIHYLVAWAYSWPATSKLWASIFFSYFFGPILHESYFEISETNFQNSNFALRPAPVFPHSNFHNRHPNIKKNPNITLFLVSQGYFQTFEYAKMPDVTSSPPLKHSSSNVNSTSW